MERLLTVWIHTWLMKVWSFSSYTLTTQKKKEQYLHRWLVTEILCCKFTSLHTVFKIKEAGLSMIKCNHFNHICNHNKILDGKICKYSTSLKSTHEWLNYWTIFFFLITTPPSSFCMNSKNILIKKLHLKQKDKYFDRNYKISPKVKYNKIYKCTRKKFTNYNWQTTK